MVATANTLGTVKIGDGLGVDLDGEISINAASDSLDGRYLRIDAGTFDQTVKSTGDVDFSGDVTIRNAILYQQGTIDSSIAIRAQADTTTNSLSSIRATGTYTGNLTVYYGFYSENGASTGTATDAHGFCKKYVYRFNNQ